MKLLKIINKRYALFSVATLIAGIILIFFFLRYFIDSETVEKLEDTKHYVIKSLDAGDKIEFYPLIDVIELDNEQPMNLPSAVTDTTIYNPVENEFVVYKQISFVHIVKDTKYLILVRTDKVETIDIIISLGLPLFLLILAVLIISNIIVNRINLKVWNPFYKNLNILKAFAASDKEELKLVSSEIDEFKDLNNSLTELTNRIRKDYRELKEFSENASHELQTPLSIIRIKIESMMQNENIDGEQLEKIQSVYKMINRISRLNKSLTLLSKLGSIEFEKKDEVSLKDFTAKKVDDFSEIAGSKNISIHTEMDHDKKIFINPDLLEILFSNLFSNAIRYNTENGLINIKLTQNELTFSNSGKPLLKDPEKMFERFEKGEQSEESSGLGLTIVKQICLMNGLSIMYNVENSFHVITVNFPK